MLLLRLEDFNVEDMTLGPGSVEELGLDGDRDVVLPAGAGGLHAGLTQVRGQAGGRGVDWTSTSPALHEGSEAGPDYGLEVLPEPPGVGGEAAGGDPEVRSALPSSAGHYFV